MTSKANRKRLIAFFIGVCFVLGCKENVYNIKSDPKYITFITTNKPGLDSSESERKAKRVADILKAAESYHIRLSDTLHNGLKIRIWNLSDLKYFKIIEIWNTDSSWSGKMYWMEKNFSESEMSSWTVKEKILKTPENGWKSFIKSLVRNDVFFISEKNRIKADAHNPSDANYFLMEIFTSTKLYRYMSFEPFLNQGLDPDELKFSRILREYEAEFGFKWFP